MTGTAVASREGVALETGEVVAIPAKFEMHDYLTQLRRSGAIENQQQLAAAYDEACRALIGPNDIQREGKREFKKKSAWRKLARHFHISIEAEPGDTRFQRLEDGSWLATARAVAVAPWGQRFADVGACGSDEQTGRRVITMADAIATAMTRAVNRAVSNLIAMGEVSAEEIGDRASGSETHDALPDPEPTSETPWPGEGPIKGKLLRDFTDKQLLWLVHPDRRGAHIEVWQGLGKDEINRRMTNEAASAEAKP